MEICIDSVDSAINAKQGGATRVELCSSLVEGGCTPSLGLFQVIKSKVPDLPVFVMIRPRGGDFLYNEHEFETMKRDISVFKENHADGFVFGILTADGSVDMDRNKQLVEMCAPAQGYPAPVTFHRAFDVVRDMSEALESLITLGFDRVLTSGLESTALEGMDNLRELISLAGDRIIVVPGGGITEKNLHKILSGTGASEFHCSARISKTSEMTYRRSDIHMGAAFHPPEYTVKVSCEDRVSKFGAIYREFKK